MKKIVSIFLICTLFIMSSCASVSIEGDSNDTVTIEDSTGNIVDVKLKPEKVVTVGSSVTDAWLLSGGKVTGTSSDSFDRELAVEDAEDIGRYNDPSLEQIIKINPDMVVMSSNISAQAGMKQTLEQAAITVLYEDINSFDEYLNTLDDFTTINDTPELYELNGTDVKKQIDEAISETDAMDDKTGLILRTSSVILKTLDSDNFAVKVMEDMGINNIANSNKSILEDMSIEAIMKEDPDYIFLVIMGSDENASMEKINTYIAENPAWNTLSAVENDRFIILPKDLFHYKPNNRWGEAYEYIYDIRQKNE